MGCTDAPPTQQPPTRQPCGSLDVTSLCRGVAELSSASCAQLANVSYVADLVRRIGLYRDPRGARLYGAEAQHQSSRRQEGAVPEWQKGAEHRTKGGTYENYEGIWQDPVQLASALVYLLGTGLPVSDYAELGVWTGWTTTFIAAYLSRTVEPPGQFSGLAVDVNDERIATPTRQLMDHLNVRYVHRSNMSSHIAARRRQRPTFDLCLLDALHDFQGIYADYEEMAPRCRIAMFHDIVQYESFHQSGGGVPRFWSMLVRAAGRERTVDFVQQPGTFPTVLGLGMLLPDAHTGTAEVPSRALWNKVWRNQLQARGGGGAKGGSGAKGGGGAKGRKRRGRQSAV